MHLTISYGTFRREPMLDWFWKSLIQQALGDWSEISVVIVDGRHTGPAIHSKSYANPDPLKSRPETIVTAPKPCVFNGPHRLTKNEYFCASNCRNTGLCFAKDGAIAYVDDLSILMPGWLKAVREAMKHNYIVCGAYRKVLKLDMLPNGDLTYENFPGGWDHRWSAGREGPVPTHSNWLFGCSVAGPVNAFLKINGWPEMADSTGLGGEDYLTGMALEATGHKLMYDRRMLTLESEERHHSDNGLLRVNKHRPDWDGVTDPDIRDKGHELINLMRGATCFPNDFTPFPDLAALRQHILAGGEFPIMKTPDRDWYDGQPLTEL